MASPSVVLNPEGIPQVLKSQKRWATYTLEPRPGQPGKFNKAPRDASLRRMEWKNPENWLTYDEAITCYHGREKCDGVGVFLGDYDGQVLWGFDMDGHVIDEFVSPHAQEIIDALDSYTEYSPSGTGVHVLFYGDGTKPAGDRQRNDEAGLELYGADRFLTITGERIQGKNYLRSASPAVAYGFIDPNAKKPQTDPSVVSAATNTRHSDKSVENVINELHWLFPNAAVPLWNGDISAAANDHSAADAKLVYYLTGICEGDEQLIDAAFRRSGLMRPKWDEMRGDRPYNQITIDHVVNGRNDGKYLTPYDFAAHEQMVRERISKALRSHQEAGIPKSLQGIVEELKQPSDQPSAILEDLSGYMLGGIDEEITGFRQFDGISSGWPSLDEAMGSVYPGLYLVGAAPASGKTTFCWQLAENLAEQGHPAIYFTLEQTRLEMVSKSLARRVFQWHVDNGLATRDNCPSSLYIRKGWHGDGLDEARDQLTEISENLFIVPGSLGLNVETITATVENFIKDTGRRPFVFVDYMQLLTTADPTMQRDRRLMMDHVAKALKIMQRDHNLSVFVITAYSRDGYYVSTQLGSGKESGGLEYTCDVQWGIDFACLHEKDYDSKNKAAEAVVLAKREKPRRMVLTCVKNRMGEDFKVPFHYYSKHDYFAENRTDRRVLYDSGGHERDFLGIGEEPDGV